MKEIILITENPGKFSWLSENFVLYFVELQKTLDTCLNKFDSNCVFIDFTTTNNPETIKKLLSWLTVKNQVAVLINNSVSYKFDKEIFLINEQELSKSEIEQQLNKAFPDNLEKQNSGYCLTQKADYLVAQLSAEGSILFANRSFTSELGLKPGDLLLKNFSSLMPEEFLGDYQESLINAREKNEKQSFRADFFSKDDQKKYFDFSIKYFEDENKFLVFCKDVSQLINIRNTLIEKENQYNQIFEYTHEGIWVIDENHNTTMVNPSMANMLGYKVDEIIGKDLFSFIGENEKPLLENNTSSHSEIHSKLQNFRFVHKDGHPVYTNLEDHTLTDSSGNYKGSIAITNPLENNQINKLPQQKDFTDTSVNHNPVGIVSFTKDGQIKSFNDAFAKFTGLPEQTLKNLGNFAEEFFPDLKNQFSTSSETLEATTFTTDFITESSVKPVEVITKTFFDNDNALQTFTAFISDISEARQTEKKLKLELEINKAIARISNKITTAKITTEEICSFVLKTVQELTQSEEGFISVTNPKSLANVIYASTEQILEDLDIYKTGEKLFFFIYENEKLLTLRGKNANEKKTFFVNDVQKVFETENIFLDDIKLKNFMSVPCSIGGRLIGQIYLGNKPGDYNKDDILKITQIAKIFSLAIQRKQFEEEQKHLQEVLFNMLNEVYIIDISSYMFSYVNNVAVTNLGYSFEEFSQMGPTNIFKYTDDSEEFEYINSVITKQAKKVTFEGIHIRKDKSVYPVEISVQLIQHGEIEELLAVVMDITEKKRLEQHRHELEATMRQQQKLEAIGMLASGVAHEINSPLMGMINYAELINRRTDNEKLKSFSQGIIDEGDRVAKIVKNLLAFARQEKEIYEFADIQDIVKSSLVLVGAALRKNNIQIDVKCDNKLLEVSCRSQQIQQVFINLLTNSRDALNRKFGEDSDEKRINITCKNLVINQINFVQITFEDNGTGIKSEQVNKIFDPFFTTKTKEQGTGLGLSISHSIISEHNGRFTCKSELGKFTRFKITLPVTQEFYQTTTTNK
ncbi:MAG: PAS domain S-box protein [Rhodothermaceae bacterium]